MSQQLLFTRNQCFANKNTWIVSVQTNPTKAISDIMTNVQCQKHCRSADQPTDNFAMDKQQAKDVTKFNTVKLPFQHNAKRNKKVRYAYSSVLAEATAALLRQHTHTCMTWAHTLLRLC